MSTAPLAALAVIRTELRRMIDAGEYNLLKSYHFRSSMLAAEMYLEYRPRTKRFKGIPLGWPWPKQLWRPRDWKTNLTRAGAALLVDFEWRLLAGEPIDATKHKLDVVMALLDETLPQPELFDAHSRPDRHVQLEAEGWKQVTVEGSYFGDHDWCQQGDGTTWIRPAPVKMETV